MAINVSRAATSATQVAAGPLPKRLFDARASRSRRWWLIPLLIGALALGVVVWRSPNFGGFSDDTSTPFAGDFLQEWIGSYVVRTEGAARLFDLAHVKSLQHDPQLVGFAWDGHKFFAMVYPPFYYALLTPLSYLPYRVAGWLFVVTMVTCFFAAALLLVRYESKRRAPNVATTTDRPPVVYLSAALFLLAPLFVPLIRSLTTGQKGTLCLLILTSTFVLLQSRRPVWAGVVFGLLAFKPQLAIVIGVAMLLKGQWRFVAGTVLTGSILAIVSLGTGADACWRYFEFCTGVADYVHTSGYGLYKSHCLYGFLTLLGGGHATPLVKIATLLAAALTIGMLYALLRGPLSCGSARFARQFSGLVIATLLLSPHLFTYDLTMLVLPMFVLAGAVTRGEIAGRPGQITMGLIVALYVVCGFSHLLAATAGLQLSTLLMVGLLWHLAKQSAVTDSEPVPAAIALA